MFLSKKEKDEIVKSLKGTLETMVEERVAALRDGLREELKEELKEELSAPRVEEVDDSPTPKKGRNTSKEVAVVSDLKFKKKEDAVPEIIKESDIAKLLVESLKRHGRNKTVKEAGEICDKTLSDMWESLSVSEQKSLFEFCTRTGFTEFSKVWQKWHDAISKKV
jgi:hypothetical protein